MEEKRQYIAYYRVSTEEQGHSGLGLKAQQASVRTFAENTGELVGEFTEIESGSNNDRVQLNLAIQACKTFGADLVVKNLSRISRGGYKVMVKLEELGINYIECTSPYDNQLMKEFKFSMAKDELEKISERTSSALQEIKKKLTNGERHVSKSGNVITSLGSPQNLTPEAIEKAAIARSRNAASNENNKRATSLIVALRKAGLSFYAITAQLNDTGFKTSRGNNFSEVQTKRLFDRHNKLKVETK